MDIGNEGSGQPQAAGQADAELAPQEQAAASYGSKAGSIKLFRRVDELQPDEIGSQEAELLPGFWKHLPNVFTTTLQNLVNWGRQNSLWYYPVGTACCAIEGIMAAGMSRFDLDRHGMVPWFSPRQCDVMLVAGTVTEKMAPIIRTIYEQMAEPRWVVAIGGCAVNGGPFYMGYNVVDGIDKLVPVDVYIPGCPPRPEAVIHGIYMLREKIRRAGVGDKAPGSGARKGLPVAGPERAWRANNLEV